MITRFGWAAAFALVSSGCGSGGAPPERLRTAAGSWTSEGYGYFFELTADSLRGFEVTAISCLPSFRGAAVAAPAGALGAFRLVDAPVTLIALGDTATDRIRLHVNGTASDLVLRPGSRPAGCDRPTPDTPRSNFEVFATTWAEHYPFFELKGADWSAITAAARARVTDSTPPGELFAILEGMIAPFEDAHTVIVAESLGKRFSGSRRTASWVERDRREAAYALTDRNLGAPLRKFCEGQLEFARIPGDVGYLRIRSFSRYHADGSFESGLAALEAALDTVFADTAGWRGLVIDVRINGGGADPYGLAIAARLTDREYLAYAKQARSDPADPSRWTDPQPSLVRPNDRPGWNGAVVELIGIQSISAAETFTQALLLREPKVIRLGENTQGVFSDVLGRRLPNGWRIGLPNERFVTEGRSYDGPGIPADEVVPSFTPAGLRSGKDAALARARALLGAR